MPKRAWRQYIFHSYIKYYLIHYSFIQGSSNTLNTDVPEGGGKPYHSKFIRPTGMSLFFCYAAIMAVYKIKIGGKK